MDFNRERLEAAPYSIENVGPSNRDIRCLLNAPYEHETSYINGFNDSVVVIERDGIVRISPPQRDRNNINFIVRHTYKVPKSIGFDVDKTLLTDSNLSLEYKAIIKAGEKVLNKDDYFSDTHSFSIDYIIPREVIERRGGSIYLIERDVVISLRLGNNKPNHPFSIGYQKERLLKESKDIVNEDVFGFSIKIVDNNGTYGNRYVNLNGKAYLIPARRDNILNDGVYYTCTGQAYGNYDLCPPETHKYAFSEADKALNLYRSVEDALTYGDPIKAKEKELERLKMEHKEKEMIFDNEKLELKRVINDQETDIKKKTNDYADLAVRLDFMRKEVDHFRALDKLQRTDHYDERSHRRKDWSETLKYIPAVITTIGAGYIAWQKFKSSST